MRCGGRQTLGVGESSRAKNSAHAEAGERRLQRIEIETLGVFLPHASPCSNPSVTPSSSSFASPCIYLFISLFLSVCILNSPAHVTPISSQFSYSFLPFGANLCTLPPSTHSSITVNEHGVAKDSSVTTATITYTH